MERKLKEILRLFMQSQIKLNELFNEDIESIKNNQDGVTVWLSRISNRLNTITECMDDLENRLNKLEKEKRNNASNK